ncbi:MAG: hypothetical protein U5R48_00705 [Gammaproteobacteria bacterium]|nr:hypothetical protein [Gammaproteobacteria bacterium]
MTYWSPKLIDLKGRVPFITLVAIVMVYAIVMTHLLGVLLGLFVGYALSGPLEAALAPASLGPARRSRWPSTGSAMLAPSP